MAFPRSIWTHADFFPEKPWISGRFEFFSYLYIHMCSRKCVSYIHHHVCLWIFISFCREKMRHAADILFTSSVKINIWNLKDRIRIKIRLTEVWRLLLFCLWHLHLTPIIYFHRRNEQIFEVYWFVSYLNWRLLNSITAIQSGSMVLHCKSRPIAESKENGVGN